MLQLKWGVLGYAGIARNHVIPAMVEADNAVPYAIASRSVEKLDDAVTQFGFRRAYQDYEALLADSKVQAVYVPLPNALHKEWALKAMRAGKHVLCEKPLAQTPEDCQEMIDAARACGVVLMEAFMYRLTPRVQKLRELIDAGAIGELRAIYSSHRFCLTDHKNVRVNATLGGGSLWDVGCYPVNLIGLLTGCEPLEIRALREEFQGVDASLSAVMRYPGGVMCTLSCGFDSQCAMVTEINGTQGSLVLTDTFDESDAPIRLIRDGREDQIAIAACHRYTLEIEDFGKAVLTGRPLIYNTDETVRNTRVINRILEAAK